MKNENIGKFLMVKSMLDKLNEVIPFPLLFYQFMKKFNNYLIPNGLNLKQLFDYCGKNFLYEQYVLGLKCSIISIDKKNFIARASFTEI